MLNEVIDHILLWSYENDRMGGFNDPHATTNIRLNQTLYLFEAYHFQKYRQGFFNEQFELWGYGVPVIAEVYKKFSVFGGNGIKLTRGMINELEYIEGPVGEMLNELLEEIAVIETYDLSDILASHDPIKEVERYLSREISKESMKRFYAREK